MSAADFVQELIQRTAVAETAVVDLRARVAGLEREAVIAVERAVKAEAEVRRLYAETVRLRIAHGEALP